MFSRIAGGGRRESPRGSQADPGKTFERSRPYREPWGPTEAERRGVDPLVRAQRASVVFVLVWSALRVSAWLVTGPDIEGCAALVAIAAAVRHFVCGEVARSASIRVPYSPDQVFTHALRGTPYFCHCGRGKLS